MNGLQGGPLPVINGRGEINTINGPIKMGENKCVTGVITLLIGVIVTPSITGTVGAHLVRPRKAFTINDDWITD